jgi:hypothetical protein
MNEMTNQETDTALILENELQRRVKEVTRNIIQDEIRKEVKRIFLEQKDSMLMEVCISVGKTLKVVENEGRKPLWEANPKEFGLTREALNTHNIQKVTDALREQTPSL